MKTLLLHLSQKSNSLRWTIAKKSLIAVFLFFMCTTHGYVVLGQVTETITTSQNWTCPAGVTSVTITAIGGGGAGGGSSATDRNGGGGGGGASARLVNYAVTPGGVYTIAIGAGGTGVTANTGNAGGSTTVSFNSTIFLRASGGAGGTRGANATTAGFGGLGGSIANNIPVNNGFNGGNGGNSNPSTGSADQSGGGGGGAGISGAGGNGGIITAGLAGAGGLGGAGGAGRSTTNGSGANGFAGAVYGGGGGGSTTWNSGTRAGANGAAGVVQITYIAPAVAPSCAGSPTAPVNAATNISTTQQLSWPAVSNTTGYDVYFGISNPATTLVSTNQAGTTYNPGTLNASTTYYWRIVPRNSSGLASGCATWSFTTGVPGCTNGTAFTTFTPTCSGTQQIYNTCAYAGDYNTLTLNGGTAYLLGSSITSDYITVTTSAGVIITAGVQPLSFSPAASGQYRVYYHTNAACGTAAACRSVWVQCGTVTPPANDACANATSLPCGTSALAGTTVNSVSETAPGGCVGTNGVWYSFVGNGQVTTITAFSSLDLGLYVGSGSCGGLTQVQCVDGFLGNSNETASFTATNGVTYYVYVANYTGSTTGTFTISRTCSSPPANDNCANAQSVTVQCAGAATTINGTTAGATTEAGLANPTCDPAGTFNDVWYSFNSGANTSVNLAVTLGTANWLGGQVFTTCGTVATGLSVGGGVGSCDFNLASPSPTLITGLVPNTTYRIRMFTNVAYDIAGTFSFTLTSAEAAPTATITASGATTFCAGQSVTLTANSGTGYTYQWNLNGSPISGATSISHVVTSSGSYTVRVTNASGCNNATSAATVVTVNNTPDFANLQWPATATVNCGSGVSVFGKVFEPGVTPNAGADPSISVQIGVSTTNTNPSTWAAGAWSAASYNGQVVNDDEYTATIGSTLAPGTYYYTFRYQIGNSGCFVYGGFQGGFWNGTSNVNGTLTVNGSILDWANVQFPTSGSICVGGNYTVYGQVFESGATNAAGATPGMIAEIGVSSTNTDPATWAAGAWSAASFNAQAGNNDEFVATIGSSLAAGTYFYAFRYRLASACNYQYGAINGFWNGTSNQNGTLTINAIPTVTANATSTSVCTGQSVTLTGGGATSYSWNNGVSNGVAFTPTNTVTYTVTGTTAGCSSTANVTVTFSALTSSTLPTSGDYVWRGSSSSDYATVANWLQHNGTSLVAATVAPTTSTNVIIPAPQTCVLNQPALGSNTVNAKNVTIESSSTLSLNTGTLNMTGNFTNNGSFNAGTGTVAFTGTTTQLIGGSNVTEFYNLTMNNNHSGAYPSHVAVKLEQDATVTNTLTLTDGILDVFNNVLTLGTPTSKATISPALGSADAYVAAHHNTTPAHVGYVKQFVHSANVGNGTAYNFPIGDDGKWTPYILTFDAGTSISSGSFITSHVNDALITGSSNSNFQSRIVRDWEVEPSNGITTPNYTIEIFHNQATTETGGLASSGSVPFKKTSGTGQLNAPTNALGINSPSIVEVGTYTSTGNSFTWTGLTSFSNFGGTDVNQALPIELVSFQANCKEDNTVSVTWTTASEHNTSHYVVEKSRDGSNWSVLGQTAAAGNSTQLLNYEMIDSEKASGTTYYRLTQFDNDGVFEVFDPVSVNCNAATTNNHITTYPNPSLDGFYVSLFTETMEGNGQLTITDASGRPVYGKSVNIQDGNNVFHIGDLNAAPGMYYIQVTQSNTTTDIVKHSLR